MPVFPVGRGSDDPEQNEGVVLRRLMLLEDTVNRVCRAFNGIHTQSGGDLHLRALANGEVELSIGRPLGEGTGVDTTMPWYVSNDGTNILCNGGLVLRARGKNGYGYTDLADLDASSVLHADSAQAGPGITIPTDGNAVVVAVAVEVASFGYAASWTCGGSTTTDLALQNVLADMDADTFIWPIAGYSRSGDVLTKTIYHVGGALVLPLYG